MAKKRKLEKHKREKVSQRKKIETKVNAQVKELQKDAPNQPLTVPTEHRYLLDDFPGPKPKPPKRKTRYSGMVPPVPPPALLDLVHEFLRDFKYIKAAHGVRTDNQKRPGHNMDQWKWTSQGMPGLLNIFLQWRAQNPDLAIGREPANAVPKRTEGMALGIYGDEDEGVSQEDKSDGMAEGRDRIEVDGVHAPASKILGDSDASEDNSDSDDGSSSSSSSDLGSDSDSDKSDDDAPPAKKPKLDPATFGAPREIKWKKSEAEATKEREASLTVSSLPQPPTKTPTTVTTAGSDESDSPSKASSDDKDDELEDEVTKLVNEQSVPDNSQIIRTKPTLERVSKESDSTATLVGNEISKPAPREVASGSDSDSDTDSDSGSSISSDSSSESSSESSVSSSSNDSDEEPVSKLKTASKTHVKVKVMEKSTAKPKPKPKEDSNSDSESEASSPSSSSSSLSSSSNSNSDSKSETNQISLNNQRKTKTTTTEEVLVFNSSNTEPGGQNILPATPQNIKNLKKKKITFSRIPANLEIDQRFNSNRYVPYDYAENAQKTLEKVKGKAFTKATNKGKRGSYRGGTIDVNGGKAIKFDD